MAEDPTSVDVADLASCQPLVRAVDFAAPLVCRLLGSAGYQDGHSDVTDSYRSAAVDAVSGRLRVRWSGLQTLLRQYAKTYQEHVITEFAAIGMAFLLLHWRAGAVVTEVTRRGDRADYWLGEKECLVEISGQVKGDLLGLLKDKAVQLAGNPFSKPGYVCVANFSTRKSFLWYFENREKLS